ncbi:hypothetical protein LSAT2_014359 [Lamellibrachia satsuma]|nr:hypothetical protein LSAT2_014359 [Lamellibrachia satsuma]
MFHTGGKCVTCRGLTKLLIYLLRWPFAYSCLEYNYVRPIGICGMSPYHQPSVAPPRPATSLPCARVTSENEVKLRAQLWEWGLSTPTSRTLIRCAALSPASIAKMASLTATWILMLCLAPSTGKSPSHDDNDVSARQSVNDVTKLDAAFTKYVYDQQLYGAALGVLHKGKLIYGDGRGFVRGDDAAAGTLMPVLGLSKLLTALAVLRLADHGKLRLDDKLFGHGGLLQRHRPRDGDQRLGHITVEHLLRHQGGWDETIEPLYDPMLNELYVHRQYNVTDIARELGRRDVRLEQADIMRYVLGRPLAFAPGSRTVHSNFGYSLLGRVIKAASGASYHAYVRRHVLVPVGMWHTRIGPDPHEDAAGHLKSGGQSEASTTGKPRYIYDLLRPGVIDSTLGWHSNVYDLARLVANVFESGDADTAILRPESVKRMLARPALPTPQHSERWQGMGDLRVQNDGTFWYESHDPILHTTIFLYHKQGVRATTNKPTATSHSAAST